MDSLINELEQNTNNVENKVIFLQQHLNRLWSENMYLKTTIQNNQNIATDLNKIFQDPNIKKYKNEFVKLNKLVLLLHLKYNLSKEHLTHMFENNSKYEILSIKSKLYVKRK